MQLAKILFSEYDVFGRVLIVYGAKYTRSGGKMEAQGHNHRARRVSITQDKSAVVHSTLSEVRGGIL